MRPSLTTAAGSALVALVVSACSGGPASPTGPTAPAYRNGARLRARLTDAGGGARRFDGWYDSQLATPCTFRIGADGVSRCIPMADTVASEPAFLDPACTVPAELFDDSLPIPTFLATNVVGEPTLPVSCAPAVGPAGYTSGEYLVTAWRIGPEASGASTLYQLNSAGGCSGFPISSGRLFQLEEVPAASLVAATRARAEPRGAAMSLVIAEADDGSEATGQMVDLARNQPCFPSWVYAVTSDYRCYGSTASNAFTALNCTETDVTAGAADEIYLDTYTFCDQAPTFRKLAPPTCQGAPVTGEGCHSFALGDPFPATDFPALASDMVGTGRVRLVVSHAADDDRGLIVNPSLFASAGRYSPGPFFDTDRQVSCDAATFEDGSLRCLTADVLSADSYADPDCTVPIAQAPAPSDGSCTTPSSGTVPALAFSRDSGRTYALGALVERTNMYYLNHAASPPACMALAQPAGTMFYELSPGDPGVFATLTTVTE
jgi:hypothetical protein